MKNYIKQWWLYLYRNGLAKLAQLAQPSAKKAKLKIEKNYRVDIGRPGRISVLLVGCGGTGGYAAHILAQFGVWAKGQSIDVRLYFIDPDGVEEKNLVRQNFCRAEIGYPKAFTLAWRYTAAFGLKIIPVVERFSAEMLERYRPSTAETGSLTVIIGAVDNAPARRDIAEAIERHIEKQNTPGYQVWWIDSGNERVSGQILAGSSLEAEPLLTPLGYCTALPFPHIQEPGLLAERPALQLRSGQASQEDLSCAELGLLEEQGAMINRVMAGWIGVYLYRLLQSRDLSAMATWVDLGNGSVRSVPIAGGRLLKPKTPRRIPVTPVTDAGLFNLADVAGQFVECPQCGGSALVEGDDWMEGVLIRVRFCPNCTFREEGCPECWGELEESTRIGDRAGPIPVLRCTECPWNADMYPEPEPHLDN